MKLDKILGIILALGLTWSGSAHLALLAEGLAVHPYMNAIYGFSAAVVVGVLIRGCCFHASAESVNPHA